MLVPCNERFGGLRFKTDDRKRFLTCGYLQNTLTQDAPNGKSLNVFRSEAVLDNAILANAIVLAFDPS